MKKDTQTNTIMESINRMQAILDEVAARSAQRRHDIAVASGSIVRGIHELDTSPITAFRDSMELMLRAQTFGPDYVADFQKGYLANDRKIAAAKQGVLKASL